MKGGEHIGGSNSRVILTSYPKLYTVGVKVRLTPWESLLEAREEGKRRQEGGFQDDTGIKGIPLEMGCFLTLVILLHVYFFPTSHTI